MIIPDWIKITLKVNGFVCYIATQMIIIAAVMPRVIVNAINSGVPDYSIAAFILSMPLGIGYVALSLLFHEEKKVVK